jgi:hypothetical protein
MTFYVLLVEAILNCYKIQAAKVRGARWREIGEPNVQHISQSFKWSLATFTQMHYLLFSLSSPE